MNWSLIVFPLVWPALNLNFYTKISGKNAPNRYVKINNAICTDLAWAITHLEHKSGIKPIQQLCWDALSADFMIYCNTCLEDMGFWVPDQCVGFYSPVPDGLDEDKKFYFQVLCLLSALYHVIDMHHPQQSWSTLTMTTL